MRIAQLELQRYGHFTDTSLEFHRNDLLTPDLHIVHGPNEAGKSTTRAAILDLLFGFPRISPWNFLHGYRELSIQATLELDSGQSRSVIRRKNGLHDLAERLLPEHTLDVHGLNRDSYILRFCFDGDALKDGSDEILKRQGELGSALFTASSGLADLQARADASIDSALEFQDGRKKSGKILPRLREEHQSLQKQLRASDTTLPAWQAQQQRLRHLQKTLTQLQATLTKSKSEHDQVRRRVFARRFADRILALRRERAALKSDVPLPPDRRDRLNRLLAELQQLRRQQLEQTHQLDALSGQLDEHRAEVLDETALDELQHLLDLWNEQPYSQAHQNEQQQTQNALGATLHTLAQQLGLEYTPGDTDAFNRLHRDVQIPTRQQLEQLAPLQEAFQPLQRSLEHAQREHEEAAQRYAAIHVDDKDRAEPDDGRAWAATLTALRDAAPQVRLRDALQDLAEQRARLGELQKGLDGGGHEITALQAVPVPGYSTLDALDQRLEQQASARRELKRRERQWHLEQREARQRCQRLSAELGLDAPGAEHGTHPQRRKSFEHREQAWSEHMQTLQSASTAEQRLHSAQRFRRALDADDQAVSVQLDKAESLATLQAAEQQWQLIELRGELLAEELSALEQDGAALEQERTTLNRRLGLPAEHSLHDVQQWLQQRERVLDSAQALATTEARVRQLSQECHSALERLGDTPPALNESDTAHALQVSATAQMSTLSERLEQSELKLSQMREAHAHWRSREQSRKDAEQQLTLRQENLARSEQQMQLWQQHWHDAAGHSALATAEPSSLALWKELRNAIDQYSERLPRWQAHAERERQLLQRSEACINTLVQAGLSLPDSAREQVLPLRMRALHRVLEQQRERQHQLQQQQREYARVQLTLEQGSAALAQRSQELESMLQEAEVADVDALQARLDADEACRQLEQTLGEQERALVEALGAEDIDSAMDTLTLHAEADAAFEEDLIAQHIETLQDEREQLRSEIQTLQRNHEALAQRADAPRLRSELDNLEGDIVARARQALRARLGREALLSAMERYRDAHKGSLLTGASRIFADLTQGHYPKLEIARTERGEEILLAIGNDQRSLDISVMSSSTRSQLYLALRMAAWHDYVQQHSPLPFIIDDVLESFDNERAMAALQQMARMGQRGQVIYLTHHEHLVDLARQQFHGQINVQSLPPSPRSSSN